MARDGEGRRLLVVSPGSMEVSIHRRNALGRLLVSRLDGFFREVDYVFFRTEEARLHVPEEGFRVHDVSGLEPPGLLERIVWLRRLWLMVSGWRRIRAIARRAEPDVVASSDPFLSGLIAYLLSRLLGVPFAVTVYSNFKLSYEVGEVNPLPVVPPRVAFGLERWILERADLVQVDRAYYRRYAVERGADPEVVRTIPMYADPAYYDTAADPDILDRVGVPDPEPLVYVGRLSPEKYADDLVECFLGIRERRPGSHLIVVGGSGTLREWAVERVRAAGAGGGFHLVEGLDAAEIFSVLSAAGTVLVTHGGYSLLEACLAGAPVVAYDYEWHPELVTDGETGRLVPYRDVDAMTEAAVGLLENPERARALGDRARTVARATFAREHTVRKGREAFEWLLERERR